MNVEILTIIAKDGKEITLHFPKRKPKNDKNFFDDVNKSDPAWADYYPDNNQLVIIL